MAQSLADRLAPIIAQYADSTGAHYERMTAFVEKIDQLALRLGPGAKAPDFVLPAQDGSLVQLSELSQDKPLVLFFIRGMWCPYCHEQVHATKDMLREFESAGVNVAVVTPEVGGRAAELAADLDLPFPVLCDVDSGMALAYGCLYPVPNEDREFLKSIGIDLAKHYGTNAWFIPLPSVFVIGTDGVVRSVYGSADPRIRPEPAEILNEIRQANSVLKD